MTDFVLTSDHDTWAEITVNRLDRLRFPGRDNPRPHNSWHGFVSGIF